MSREEMLSAMLREDIVLSPNTVILKKLLLCVHHGWFRINGLSPDRKYTLGDYLLDDERLIIDFTRISEQSREKFLNWFVVPHGKDASQELLREVTTNNYRGYTAEVGLSRWGRLINALFRRKRSYHWDLDLSAPAPDYQLTGIEICQDTQGLLIGLDQFSIDETRTKYHKSDDNQVEPLRNTKRVILTDEMVNKIVSANLAFCNYDEMIAQPHPFSINVASNEQRMIAMKEYRFTQRLVNEKPWYMRFFNWIKNWFQKKPQVIEMEELSSRSKKYNLLFEEAGVRVCKREYDGQILVVEKRPELDSTVFCGGGAKIFAHVGSKKAFEESQIEFSKYAGSSAGAIMAILCYLGYSSQDILIFFQWFKQDNLIHYEIDSSGFSDTRALKAALDYMIIKKVNEIIRKYEIDKTLEGRQFLSEKVFKNGKITFQSLHFLKQRYPDCDLGEKLTVTATNVKNRKTRYFSYASTPSMEVSEAVKASASFPVVFKPAVVEGETHNDGGILSNLPTEVFQDDGSTLLESEHGNCLSMVAFQFDNGYERGLLDKLVDRVYREHFLWNWFYGLLTGVKDPVSGWERDRLKLLQHSNQVVLIPVGKISSTQFDLDEQAQKTLVENGYQAAKNYIEARYARTEKATLNEEHMYSSFSSLEELLYYCCYRGNEKWFERVAKEVIKEGRAEEKIQQLRCQYFATSKQEIQQEQIQNTNKKRSTEKLSETVIDHQWLTHNLQLFEAIYPVFHKLPYSFLKNPYDLKLFKLARHSLCLNSPLAGLRHLTKVKGERHVLLSIFNQILAGASLARTETVNKLKLLSNILQHPEQLVDATFFAQWDLLPRENEAILKLLSEQRWDECKRLCHGLQNHEEELKTILIKDDSIEEGMENGNVNYWFVQGNRSGFSV